MDNLELYKEILGVFEKKSSCARLKVAAILVRDNRIISTGWNGVPSNQIHCCDHFKDKDPDYIKNNHAEFSRNNELHAEQNAIAYSAKSGTSTNGSTIYVSVSPCTECAKLIIASGIISVYFLREYDRGIEGIQLLERAGIPVKKIN